VPSGVTENLIGFGGVFLFAGFSGLSTALGRYAMGTRSPLLTSISRWGKAIVFMLAAGAAVMWVISDRATAAAAAQRDRPGHGERK